MLELIVFQTAIAVWLYRYFAKHDRGSKEPIKELRKACFFGIGAVLVAGSINSLMVSDAIFDSLQLQSAGYIVRTAVLVAVNEELLKFVPLAIYIYKRPFFDELTDGVVYFGLAGMWFGVLENAGYTLMFGYATGIVRLIVTPFLHASFTAVCGIGLIRYKLITKKFRTVLLWLLLAIALHAVYDFLFFYGRGFTFVLGIIMAFSLSWTLFYAYRRMQKTDMIMGKAAVGHNLFCRNCGFGNQQHYLYCVRCGKRT